MPFSRAVIILLIASVVTIRAYILAPTLNTRIIGGTALMMAKGRKGSLRQNVEGSSKSGGGKPLGGGGKPIGGGGRVTSGKKANWLPVKGISSADDLPTEEEGNKIKLADTYADVLMDGATNPNGAVCIMAYGGKTYCTAVNCPTCKIPLNKATLYAPNDETNGDPRLCCDFCKTTFNLRTGTRVENAESTGVVGGIVKGLFSASTKAPLKTYELGEKNGQIVINLP